MGPHPTLKPPRPGPQHPKDHEIYQAEARTYATAATIAEGDTSTVRVLMSAYSLECRDGYG
ncbi:hypothetical protein ACH34T_25870 [Actinomadura sp. 9N215]